MSFVPEILAPAGDMERLDAALTYGADAVYLAKKMFGMRQGPGNFDDESLRTAVNKCREKGVKVYLTCNTLPRNDEIPPFEDFIKQAVDCGIDAAIAADIGIMSMIKRIVPELDIHMSTQCGIVNYAAASELYNMGAKRVVLARELSLDEIAEIRAKTPKELEIECFVHGAMCMSFSGRCLISEYLTHRDPNRGQCAQPCRWGYYLTEETREGQYFPVFEDEKGTYILNSKDMCLIDHVDKLAEAGITSFKIEGRAKSAYYVSVITNAYKRAVSLYAEDPENYVLPDSIRSEVFKVSHRDYCTGFYFGHPSQCRQYYADSGYIRNFDVCAVVESSDSKRIRCIQRNKFLCGETVELLSPGEDFREITVRDMRDEAGEPIEDTRHAAMRFSIENPTGGPIAPGSVLRKNVVSGK